MLKELLGLCFQIVLDSVSLIYLKLIDLSYWYQSGLLGFMKMVGKLLESSNFDWTIVSMPRI